MQYPKVLAIDVGIQRIGLAVSRASLAEPLKIIPANDQAFSEIARLCQDEAIDTVVVGVSEGKMAETSQEFARQLGALIDQPIVFFDETLSSRTATDKLHQAGKRRQYIDDLAAAEFLQDYLDTQVG